MNEKSVIRSTATKLSTLVSARARVAPEALGLARIGFGSVLFASLVNPLRNARAFYSDDGLYPRSTMFDLVRSNQYSIFDASGVPAVMTLLVLAAMVAALCFAVGYRTRLATLASFVLLSGLAERNLAVCDGHDTVVRVMLAWFLFAPMGARYSVDALFRRRQALGAEASGWKVPVVLAQLQVAWIYLDACLSKLQLAAWREGTAVGDVLVFGRPHALGIALRDAVPFIHVATYATLVFEGLFALLVFSPVATVLLRRIAVTAGVAFHLAMVPLFHTGWLPAVMIPLLALYLDPQLARSIARFFGLERDDAAAVSAGPVRRPVSSAILVAVAACTLWTSLPADLVEGTRFEAPAAVTWTVEALELWQSWDGLATAPTSSMTLLARGATRSGDRVNVFAGRDGSGGALVPVYDPQWRLLTQTIGHADGPRLLQFGRFLCREWNDGSHDKSDDLVTFKLVRRTETASGTVDKIIWNHQCFDPPAETETKAREVAVNTPAEGELASHL